MDTQPPLIKEKPGRDPEIEIVIPVFKNADTVEEALWASQNHS